VRLWMASCSESYGCSCGVRGEVTVGAGVRSHLPCGESQAGAPGRAGTSTGWPRLKAALSWRWRGVR